MKELILHSYISKKYVTIIRAALGIAGFIYLGLSIFGNYISIGFTVYALTNGMLGLTLLALSLLNIELGRDIELMINNQFLRINENMALSRTAHWNRVESVILTRTGIRITYESGTPERFRLPSLNASEYRELQQTLTRICSIHQISFKEKPWWQWHLL